MGNPLCPKKNLLGKICHGFLKRKGAYWVCSKNPKHRLRVGAAFDSVYVEKKE